MESCPLSLVHRILRKPFFGRFEKPWRWPKGVSPEGWQRVQIDAPAGTRLSGLWGPSFGVATATLVLAHPMGKSAKGFWLAEGHADLFRRQGWNVLVFDANGFGESSPRSFDYTADVLAAGLFAQRLMPHLPIGLVGASFGAGWGLCAMSRPESPFRVAVLEAVFPTLPEFWRHYPIAHFALKLSQLLVPSIERRMRPELAARNVVGQPKVLLVYGSADIYTPPHFGERLCRVLSQRGECRLEVLAGVGHTFALRDSPKAYREAVLPFLAQHLNSAGA